MTEPSEMPEGQGEHSPLKKYVSPGQRIEYPVEEKLSELRLVDLSSLSPCAAKEKSEISKVSVAFNFIAMASRMTKPVVLIDHSPEGCKSHAFTPELHPAIEALVRLCCNRIGDYVAVKPDGNSKKRKKKPRKTKDSQ